MFKPSVSKDVILTCLIRDSIDTRVCSQHGAVFTRRTGYGCVGFPRRRSLLTRLVLALFVRKLQWEPASGASWFRLKTVYALKMAILALVGAFVRARATAEAKREAWRVPQCLWVLRMPPEV